MLTVDTRELKQFADAWRAAPDIAREIALRAVTEIDAETSARLKQDLPKGAHGTGGGGGLAGSVYTEEHALSDRVLGIVATPLPYAVFVELGTRPHAPPIQPLIEWVSVKLGLPVEPYTTKKGRQGWRGEGAEVAWAIRSKITARGTQANPVWQKTWDAMQPRIDEILADAERKLAQALPGGSA